MSFSIEGKTAVVTGAANGVGLAVAHHFAERGANVMFADMDETRLEEEVGDLNDDEIAGLKATARAAPSCSNADVSGLPSSAFQIRAERSSDTVATSFPSGLNPAWTILSSCSIGAPSRSPVETSQTMAAPSREAVRSRLPSGLNRAELT